LSFFFISRFAAEGDYKVKKKKEGKNVQLDDCQNVDQDKKKIFVERKKTLSWLFFFARLCGVASEYYRV